MNWDAAGAVGEILGAIVVAVTLIYLAVQTRLNKKAMEASVVSNILDSFSTVHQTIIQSEEIALLHEKGQRDPGSLTKGERLRFFMLVREAFNAYSAMFRQYHNGVIDEQTWESMRFDIYVSQPGVQTYIDNQKSMWEQDFVDYIDSIEKITHPDPVSWMAGFGDNDT